MTTTIILVLGITILMVLLYRLWRTPQKPKKEVAPDHANLYFFYTNWCGWSKKAMPEWETLKSTLAKTPMFGTTTVKAIPVDAEEDRKLADEYEVEGYPTILLETASGITPYKKRVSHEGLLQFLRQSLGKERASL